MASCETNLVFLLSIDVIFIFQEPSIRAINNYSFTISPQRRSLQDSSWECWISLRCSTSMSPLLCLLNALHILLKIKLLFKSTTQRSALRMDSYEWQEVWDRMDKYQGQWAPPVFWNFTPENVQNPEKLLKYCEKVFCDPVNSRETQITGTQCAGAWSMSFEPFALPSKGREGLWIWEQNNRHHS